MLCPAFIQEARLTQVTNPVLEDSLFISVSHLTWCVYNVPVHVKRSEVLTQT